MAMQVSLFLYSSAQIGSRDIFSMWLLLVWRSVPKWTLTAFDRWWLLTLLSTTVAHLACSLHRGQDHRLSLTSTTAHHPFTSSSGASHDLCAPKGFPTKTGSIDLKSSNAFKMLEQCSLWHCKQPARPSRGPRGRVAAAKAVLHRWALPPLLH